MMKLIFLIESPTYNPFFSVQSVQFVYRWFFSPIPINRPHVTCSCSSRQAIPFQNRDSRKVFVIVGTFFVSVGTFFVSSRKVFVSVETFFVSSRKVFVYVGTAFRRSSHGFHPKEICSKNEGKSNVNFQQLEFMAKIKMQIIISTHLPPQH